MKYRLRSDLSKTTVYMVIKQFAPVGITLPTLRKCEFKKSHGSYWMYFDFDGHRFKASLDVCLGHAYVYYQLATYGKDSVSASTYRDQSIELNPDYLLSNQLLREVV